VTVYFVINYPFTYLNAINIATKEYPQTMKGSKKNLILIAMTVWVCLLGVFLFWLEINNRREEKLLAYNTAKAFFLQILLSRQWNASHGGVYVPITSKTPPNEYLPSQGRDLTADNGLKLTKINPAYMTRQIAEMAQKNANGIHFHLTSLKPIRPDNKATEWEERWLKSFELGVKDQGEFFKDGPNTWFRYMAPLLTGPECLKCHAQQGYKAGDIRGGLSISTPYPTHTYFHLFASFGAVAIIGLILIFIGGTFYMRNQRLFEAIFNSPVPTSVSDKNYTILMANEAYLVKFGPLPAHQKTIKCYEHRPGPSCHTENCPLTRIIGGAGEYTFETSKENHGVSRHFIVQVKPLFDHRNMVIGCIEGYDEITERKQLEDEKAQLINELKNSLEQVKLLSGFIPICASCKRIRDDQGFWTQVEAYISKHSEAQFSHGICPDCVKKLYPNLDLRPKN